MGRPKRAARFFRLLDRGDERVMRGARGGPGRRIEAATRVGMVGRCCGALANAGKVISARMLFKMGAEINDVMYREGFTGRSRRDVSPSTLRAAETLEYVGRWVAMNRYGTRDVGRRLTQTTDFGFEFDDPRAQTVGFGNTDLSRVHPGIEFVGNCEHVRRLFATRPADGQSEFKLPPLHRSHAAPQVAGDFLPAMQNLGFSHLVPIVWHE